MSDLLGSDYGDGDGNGTVDALDGLVTIDPIQWTPGATTLSVTIVIDLGLLGGTK